ncbi:transmembrane protein 209 isoform X1 [Leguminivora glycinivorella]|uniref:transmembrane protein 209 isoform X1 n=2 Tax=Leguminivora glycinivorella TaxID=1035111 RepID=UPI0020108E82|nr:transmembrane protein 209 isoform X1 [Leguminivora glycinivorella]
MNASLNSSLLQRTIDLQYENKKRSYSLKWSMINGFLFVVFVYDLSCKCPNYTSAFHYAEYALATVLGISLIQHGYQLFKRSPPLAITPRQRDLLGVGDADTSFRIIEQQSLSSHSISPDVSSLSASLSPRWRRNADAGSRSASASPPEPPRADTTPDCFISDYSELDHYLKQYEERSILESSLNVSTSSPTPMPPPHYQLATLDIESKLEDSGANDRSGLSGAPQVWWRLQLDPQRLTDWNLNLRLWLHVTILERLVREMAAVDEALSRIGLHDVKLGHVSVERLRQSAKTVGCGSLAAVLPFLEAFPDQKYLVQRIKELAVGGCLSNYKWNGGGSDYDDNKPTDAEIVLHLLATYLDGQLPDVGRKAFTEGHISSAPSPPPRGAGALSIHKVTSRPPHYVLALEDDTIEVCRGRNNLLHTILLLIAACARRTPPALHRVHLGPAGLNMLWIIS